jgi:hypothetical protein
MGVATGALLRSFEFGDALRRLVVGDTNSPPVVVAKSSTGSFTAT